MTRKPSALVFCLLILLLASGCVSQQRLETIVDERVASVDQRVDDVENQVEANQTRLIEQQQMINEQQEMIAAASETARQAFERAKASGQISEGTFLGETVLSDRDVQFAADSSSLSEGAKAALDTFAQDLKSRNEDVFIEIQGHTDTDGSERHNFQLGKERAEMVRHYLNMKHALPLRRMSVISYGESAPLTAEGSQAEPGQNRRVVLVVLK